MTPQPELEITGNFLAHPCAELITEIGAARLTGSLRISNKDKKSVVYFKTGKVVFAVSNSRSARLFDILLRRNKLTRAQLGQMPEFANDLQLAAFLEEKQILSKPECDQILSEQIEGIIVDLLSWASGDWTFSSLARIRDGLAFEIETSRLLVDYGRCMQVDTMLGRFRSLDESFSRSSARELDFALKPEEAFVLSRADDGSLSAADLVSVAGMSEASALHLIYTLWLGGLLTRNNWQSAFSSGTVAAMRSAKLELRKEAKLPIMATQARDEPVRDEKPAVVQPKEPEIVISLDEYLHRVENAATYYDVLGVDAKADIGELKRAYFAMAKMFHPDKYHAVGGDLLARVQKAFTELAQSHETLKSVESREVYDYRMRKELADREKRLASGKPAGGLRTEEAAQNFERGFSLLMDEEHEAALPFLARAVHFAPNNARYHAYYGKALSIDPGKRHKAESEMQAALRLDANNPTFRLLLAEFFIQHNLIKRAEGELKRLLAIFPSNREARILLDRLKLKS